jgi:D-alanyl-D-alanine dipeptidase
MFFGAFFLGGGAHAARTVRLTAIQNASVDPAANLDQRLARPIHPKLLRTCVKIRYATALNQSARQFWRNGAWAC